eukprot:CAMPEP_0178571446 /NCGR_PEP_ID=MMETSP0697-20121206/17636_1 /TAXON_ID=265572 /ORGANISM="Extubocellulus spinifer, Strain CCMP396" /LENGTH=73 /DNA_ID=CAMNT_0020205993 /DNA_START=1168 /DNA_END=1389 /DNA_ORIENTATION=-
MLINSNHDAGLGSVIIPIQTTAGAKPHKRTNRVFWNMKSMSSSLSARDGREARERDTPEFLLLGTGIAGCIGL